MASFDFDLGTGLSGAASGAAVGAQFGGPVGIGIGAGAGFLSGFLGDDSSPREKAVQRTRENLKSLVNKSPTDTTTFNVGATQLQEQNREQARRDASQAAARGLSGSQFEVSQDANRAEQMGKGIQSLLRTSSRRLQGRRQNARSQLNALLEGRAQAEARRNRAVQRSVSRLPALLSALTSNGESPQTSQ